MGKSPNFACFCKTWPLIHSSVGHPINILKLPVDDPQTRLGFICWEKIFRAPSNILAPFIFWHFFLLWCHLSLVVCLFLEGGSLCRKYILIRFSFFLLGVASVSWKYYKTNRKLLAASVSTTVHLWRCSLQQVEDKQEGHLLEIIFIKKKYIYSSWVTPDMFEECQNSDHAVVNTCWIMS